ncbi:MAG: DNA (cytosine-5-)-methyltransferase [Clostridiales bacterium]|jgi:DNA (cytosine-5)-methyltransferase 1|nr:DNA (cytosine-5-)-methyltransferase [Clostridiales bacterium]
MRLKIASMFAGIGGICLGFKQAGFDVAWANEKDKSACKTYRHNFGSDWLFESDICDVNANTIPDFDVLTAGFPCQPFSIAGKQKGFRDPRGNLFFEIARVVDVKRPKIIFLENVSNLVEHDCGRTFLVIYNCLAQFGYAVQYKVINAHEYGNLPQPRSRIYIVAFLNYTICDHFKFPEPIDLQQGINNIIIRSDKKHKSYYYSADSEIIRKYGNKIFERNYIYRISDKGLVRVRNHFCPTLTANMGFYPNRVPIVRDDYGIRKLTHREFLDFQGFPKSFTFPETVTINDAYRQIGNSVSVPVIRRIAEQIHSVLTLQSMEW